MIEEEITSSLPETNALNMSIPLEIKTMDVNIAHQDTCSANVGGPFSVLVPWTGFDLSRSKGSWAVAIATTAVCVALCIIFVARTFTLFIHQPHPMTFLWADQNLMFGLSMYSAASAICIAVWTRSGAFKSIQEKLGRIKQLRVLPNDEVDDFRGVHRRGIITMLFIVGSWILISCKDVLYSPIKNTGNDSFHIQYDIKFSSMFGVAPPLTLWMGVASSIASVVYLVCLSHLIREFEYFNLEFQKASMEHQLIVPDIFAAFGRRHSELMVLLRHTNAHLGNFGAVAPLGAMLMLITSIYISMSFYKVGFIPYLVLVTLFTFESIALLFITVGAPADIQEAIYQTTFILLEDETLPTATDPNIQHSLSRSSVTQAILVLCTLLLLRSHWTGGGA